MLPFFESLFSLLGICWVMLAGSRCWILLGSISEWVFWVLVGDMLGVHFFVLFLDGDYGDVPGVLFFIGRCVVLYDGPCWDILGVHLLGFYCSLFFSCGNLASVREFTAGCYFWVLCFVGALWGYVGGSPVGGDI